MITTKTCELAIRAVVLIAQDQSGDPVRINKLHDALDVGFSFMTKILQPLTLAGILNSYKGAKGGISLNRSAKEISVKDIVLAIDGDTLFTRCALGLPYCDNNDPCEFHHRWKQVRDLLIDTFENTTIDELAKSKKSIQELTK